MKTLLVVMMILGMGLLALDAEAFCFYNSTDIVIKVGQTGGGKEYRSFSAEIYRGDKGCCNWTNKDCNTEGKKDSTVVFKVRNRKNGSFICDVTCPAGGWAVVTGKNGVYHCEGHGY